MGLCLSQHQKWFVDCERFLCLWTDSLKASCGLGVFCERVKPCFLWALGLVKYVFALSSDFPSVPWAVGKIPPFFYYYLMSDKSVAQTILG